MREIPEHILRNQREAALLYCLCHNREEEERTYQNNQATAQEHNPSEPDAHAVIEPVHAMPETAPTAEERKYRRWNLRSQWALVIVAIVGIATAICSLHSLNNSVKAANQQAQAAATQAVTAQTQLELSERPWVGLDKDVTLISP